MVRFTGAEPVVFAATMTGCDSFRTFAHRACCARAILRREAWLITLTGADMTLVGWFAFCGVPEPFNDSITAIALSNFSTCDSASRRSTRSCWSAFARFPIVTPSVFDSGTYCRGLSVFLANRRYTLLRWLNVSGYCGGPLRGVNSEQFGEYLSA